MDMGGTKIKNTQVKIIKGGWIYSYDLQQKSGMKMKFSLPAGLDFKNMNEQMMKEMGVKQVGTETILGKECKILQYTNAEKGFGMTGKTWIFWNSEPMKMDMDAGGMPMKSHVTSIEENVNIPADKFEVPKDVKLEEFGGANQLKKK